MAVTLKQTEGVPDDYPDVPAGLSAAAAAIDPAVIWARIESYICWRWSVRDVEWIVEGSGDWSPPLKPTTIATTENWNSADAWDAAEFRPSATGGYCLTNSGQTRFVGTVGSDDAPPALVLEAYRRLAEFTAAIGYDGAGLRTETVNEVWSGEYDQRARARALQDSGAADLLRSFRR